MSKNIKQFQIIIKHYTFEYLYRDASNYKAFGGVILTGSIGANYVKQLENLLEDSQFFIAEQIKIPNLQPELFKYSNGPTEDDHGYHEFFHLRPSTSNDISNFKVWGSSDKFLEALINIGNKWDVCLSEYVKNQYIIFDL